MANKLKPIIRPVLVVTLLIVGAILFSIDYSRPQPSINTPTVKSTTPEPKPPTVKSLYKRTNQEREKRGIAPLKLDTRLNQSAKMKAEDMQKYDYFDHKNPLTNKHGYSYIFEIWSECLHASENLNENSIGDPIGDLMTSKPHRAAILDPRYESVGFAIVDKYVVQHFCDEY